MIHLSLKTLSIALVVSLSSCALAGGSKGPKDIKVYSHQPDDSYCKESWCRGKIGFVRVQSKEVKTYRQAQNFIGMSTDDFSRLLEACPK